MDHADDPPPDPAPDIPEPPPASEPPGLQAWAVLATSPGYVLEVPDRGITVTADGVAVPPEDADAVRAAAASTGLALTER